MNQDQDKQETTDIDPQVSERYELLADEETPANLDRAVLHEAARAVRADNRMGSFGAWFRPVAFMATVGLTLAIILDLSDTRIFGPPADMSLDTAPPAAARVPAEPAAEAAGRNQSQMSVSDLKLQKRSASTQSPRMDAPDTDNNDAIVSKSEALTGVATSGPAPEPPSGETPSDLVPAETRRRAESLEDSAVMSEVFTAEVESTEQRVQKLEADSVTFQQSRSTAAARPGESQPVAATRPLSQVAPGACSDAQKSRVEEWWRCIETLRQSGLTESADREFENFRQKFPDFEPPH